MSTQSSHATTSPAGLKRVVAAAMAGTVAEWYEFFLYGTASALVFGQLFFRQTDSPIDGIIAAFALYAVGFLARPIGGLVFGHYGDKFGRKRLLQLSLVVVGITTFLMGCLPGFDTIGYAAPVLLVCTNAKRDRCCALVGRSLVEELTEAGRTTLHYADQIFLLGAQLQETLQAQGETHRLRLTVGISDALPKLIAYRLLEAALHLPQGLRLICQEGEFDELLADLALHKLDVVLTNRAVSADSQHPWQCRLLDRQAVCLIGPPRAGKAWANVSCGRPSTRPGPRG